MSPSTACNPLVRAPLAGSGEGLGDRRARVTPAACSAGQVACLLSLL